MTLGDLPLSTPRGAEPGLLPLPALGVRLEWTVTGDAGPGYPPYSARLTEEATVLALLGPDTQFRRNVTDIRVTCRAVVVTGEVDDTARLLALAGGGMRPGDPLDATDVEDAFGRYDIPDEHADDVALYLTARRESRPRLAAERATRPDASVWRAPEVQGTVEP